MKNAPCAILLLVFGLLSAGLAQDISGTIGGTVLDPSGGAVPNAKVTVTNTDRNQVLRTITTGPDESYSAPFLPVGTYSVGVEAAGFRAQKREGIKLNVNDQLTINLSLEVGSVTEQVSVQAAPVQVELGTPASSGLIEETQVRELSIPTRNYEQLVALMPGVTASQTDQLYIGNSLPSGAASVMPFSINGQRNSANNWTIDGADNVDRGSNLTLLNYPSIDAITEFKVLRSLYTADSGRAGGAQINVVTKSGTTQFHGDTYEFVRNDAFAANNWINNANRLNLGPDGKARVPPLRYNDFGYTLGGPVYIPRHYNKERNRTFFFWSQEFRRVITYTTLAGTVPTASEKQGVFSVPVCVQLAGNACAQTATQISNISPIASAYLKDIFSKVPDPTTGNNLFYPVGAIFNHRQELIRIDHNFNEKFSVWGRYLHDNIPTREPGGIFGTANIPNMATTSSNSPGRSVVVHALNTISPALLNEVGYNYTYGAYLSTPIGLTAKTNAPDVQVQLPFPNALGVIPALSFLGNTAGAVIGVGPYKDYNRNHTAFDNLTWIKGRHTMKFGFSLNRYQKTENSPNGNNYGTFAFANTGAPAGTSTYKQTFANFLLGNVATYTQASEDITPDVRAWQWEAYAQDDFRVNSRLTVYVGLRYSYFGQPIDAKNELTNFDPATYNAANAPQIDTATGNLVPGTGKPLTGFPGPFPLWTGLILNGVNSPYGDKVADDNHRNFAPRVGFAWDPFGTGRTAVRAGYGIYYDSPLFGTYEQNILINPPFVYSITISNTTLQNPAGGATSTSVSTVPLQLRGTPLPNLTPYSQQWSFDLQRQITPSTLVDAGYYGSKGTHLLGIIDLNEAYPGVALAAGLHTGAGTVFTTADDKRINAVRPYRGYDAINVVEPWFNNNYHSLQVSFQQRAGAAGLFNAAYTWSKSLTDAQTDRSSAPQNTYNFHEGEYGPGLYDRRHVLTINYVYRLPFFGRSRGFAGYLVKGWEFSGQTLFATGLPFTATTSNADPAGLGILGASAVSSRPDMTCDPNRNAPHTVAHWFSPCFQPVPSGEIRPGNAGRGTIRGPGSQIWSISMFKNFQLTERVSLQLRLETFNTFNHPNPSGIGSTNITSGLYNQITSFRDPRIVQLAGKLYF
jgi:hypothetical protein